MATSQEIQYLNDQNYSFIMDEAMTFPEFWQSYVASYGTALAKMNLGAARAMQENIMWTHTVCFEKALIASESIAHIFNINYYSHKTFNFSDFYNLFQVINVKYMDQYFACNYNDMWGRLNARFTPQEIYWRGNVYGYIMINYTAMLMKLMMTLCIWLVKPDMSPAYMGYQYMITFALYGGFQNLGAGLQIIMSYLSDYYSPLYFAPIQPFNT